MKKIIIYSIHIYQKNISPFFGRSCVFYPTCSEYMKQSIMNNGIKGFFMGIKRIIRCHPWQQPKIDYPKKKKRKD